MGSEKISVQGKEISIISCREEDYISLTDMVGDMENGLALIEKWLRNKNTIEFLGIWEEINNPNFNSPEFGGIKDQAGLNRFVLSVKQWIHKTGAKGIMAKAGRYGGTFAHKRYAYWTGNPTGEKAGGAECRGDIPDGRAFIHRKSTTIGD